MQHSAWPDGDGVYAGELGVLGNEGGGVDCYAAGAREEGGAFGGCGGAAGVSGGVGG